MASPSSSKPSENEQYLALVARLRSRRLELGLSQLELDWRMGLCNGHTEKWERRYRRPTGWNLAIWIMALGGELTANFPEQSNALSRNKPASLQHGGSATAAA
jgi:hypothetical protein